MNERSQDIEQIAEKAHRGEDISGYFTGEYKAKQNATIAFPLDLLRQIDAASEALDVTREEWIRLACAEALQRVQARQC